MSDVHLVDVESELVRPSFLRAFTFSRRSEQRDCKREKSTGERDTREPRRLDIRLVMRVFVGPSCLGINVASCGNCSFRETRAY